MLEPWKKAAENFMKQWKAKPEVVASIVCGSYVTGEPSPRSDIDIHIILDDEVNWRERGNQYVDGFLIEYFANPPKQIRYYFEEDYTASSTMAMVQFLTGKVMFDKIGITQVLKSEAKVWKEKSFTKLNDTAKQLKLYHLWDALDNLYDCYETNRPDFHFVYDNALFHLFHSYCELLGIERIPSYQVYSYLTQPSYLTKYLKVPFPDDFFSALFLSCMKTMDRDKKMRKFQELTIHVFNKVGGFRIDGWRLRS